MKVLVTGAGGQLASAIAAEFARGHEVVARGRAQLDITRQEQVAADVRAQRPDVIVNCAAYNDVDGAQDDPVEALRVNAFAVRSLAEAAAEAGAAFVHYSTDFVFDGEAERPYAEDDHPAPRSFYAMSKLLGEWFAPDAGKWYLLRVESLFGGSMFAARRKGSVDRIADAIAEGREAVVFCDRTVSPSFVLDVARATRAMVEQGLPFGLYHCVNSGYCTWLDLANQIAEVLRVQPRLVPRRTSEVHLRAERPRHCALSNAKLTGAGIPMPTWQDALARYLAARGT